MEFVLFHHPVVAADLWSNLSQRGSTWARCSTNSHLAKMTGLDRPRTRFPGANRLLLESTALTLGYSASFKVRLRFQLGEVGESEASGRPRRAYDPS